MQFREWIFESFSMTDNIYHAYGTLKDFGHIWKYPLPPEQYFINLIKSLPVKTLVPSKMKSVKLNNTAAFPELVGRGLIKGISALGLADLEHGRQHSAFDSVAYHAEQLKNGTSLPVIFIQDNAYFTLLDGDHRLVAAYLTNTPFKAFNGV